MTKYDCFAGKKAVVIGGGSGIGLEVSKILVVNNCQVICVGNKEETLEKAMKELDSQKASTFRADASSSADLKLLAQHIQSAFGEIDYLVNCAGISLPEAKGVLNEAGYESLMDVNAKSVYISTMILGYPLLKKDGALVNVSSVFGRKGTPTYSSGYAAAKAAVINLTKTHAGELAPDIRVNCVAPGATYPTGVSRSWSEDFRNEIAKNLPLKRLAQPEEIAAAIVFLLSDDASFITGQTLDVNGGAWMN